MDQALQEKIDRLPLEPGVYLMKDASGRIIYVGKAVNLRARVRSYFNRGGDGRAFVPLLDRILGDIEVMVVHNEKEALLLESELIKRHKPRFNVLLKDDKSFICLRLDEKAKWPRLEVVRAHSLKRDGARYFGPYSSATSIRETLRTINRHFQLRTCSDRMLELCHKRNRPCILFQIGRCPGPCIEAISEEAYRSNVRDTVLFLEGKEATVSERIRARMEEAAERLDFESAARLRDQLRAIERSLEKQRTVSTEPIDRDVFGFYREADRLLIYVVYVRSGRTLGGRAFPFTGQEFPDEELLSSFVNVYYGSDQFIPDEVLLPFELEDLETKAAWLSDMRGRKVLVKSPRRGALVELVELARRNAETAFRENRRNKDETEEMLLRLQRSLGLKRIPRRMECYDISLFQGSSAVGSQVTFTDGEPDKARYRKFKIRTVKGTDDFAMLYEVLSRRAKRGLESGDLPDLFVIDGGKGQLGSAAAALRDAGVERDIVSLAKSRVLEGGRSEEVERSDERVFVLGRKDPIVLRQNSPELFLLARMRDEAHRFAITFHRSLRGKRTLRSALEEIPGVGPARKRELLRHFGSIKRVREASVEEIASVDSIGPALAARIHSALNPPTASNPEPEGGARKGSEAPPEQR